MWNNRSMATIMIVFCLGMNSLYGDRVSGAEHYRFSSEPPLNTVATSDQSKPNLIQPWVNLAARDQRGGRGDCTWLGC